MDRGEGMGGKRVCLIFAIGIGFYTVDLCGMVGNRVSG